MAEKSDTETKPTINVTPLIDVLLVLLIIFMVSAPLRPHRFTAKLPAEPDDRPLPPDLRTLVVTIHTDHTLKLNGLTDDMGTLENPSKLSAALSSLFAERKTNHVYRDDMIVRSELPEEVRILRTVFIKAPRSMPYGEVLRLIDNVRGPAPNP